MKFMQKHRFYVRLCSDMLVLLTKCQLLNEFKAVIAATGTFQSFDG